MTKARDARQDLVRGLGPDEGFRPRVGEGNVAPDGVLEFAGAPVDTPAELLLRQGGEPPLHEGDPRAAGRREMHMEARMPRQPAMDERGLVRAGVIHDEVDVQRARHRRINGRQEGAELPGAVPLMELAFSAANNVVVPCRV